MAILSRATLKNIFHPRSKPTAEDFANVFDSMMHKIEDTGFTGLQEYSGRLYEIGETCTKSGVILQARRATQGVFNPEDWQMPVSLGVMEVIPEGATVMVAENYQLGLFDMLTVNGLLDIKGIVIIK